MAALTNYSDQIDCTQAVLSAIEAVNGSGGTVQLGLGRYYVKGLLVIPRPFLTDCLWLQMRPTLLSGHSVAVRLDFATAGTASTGRTNRRRWLRCQLAVG